MTNTPNDSPEYARKSAVVHGRERLEKEYRKLTDRQQRAAEAAKDETLTAAVRAAIDDYNAFRRNGASESLSEYLTIAAAIHYVADAIREREEKAAAAESDVQELGKFLRLARLQAEGDLAIAEAEAKEAWEEADARKVDFEQADSVYDIDELVEVARSAITRAEEKSSAVETAKAELNRAKAAEAKALRNAERKEEN
jgi:hypothetical protein